MRGKSKFVFKGCVGYRRIMRLGSKIEVTDKYPEVRRKLEIIKFFNKYGYSTTKDAFKVGRSTVYLWKKKYQEKDVYGLVNRSRKPHNTRRMYVEPKIYEFIKDLREKHPRLGKEKIKRLLDKYCDQKGLDKISASKIGRIIKRNNWFMYLGKRTKRGIRKNKKRVFGYEVKQPGDLFQLDTVVRFEQGIKRYIITAIDVVSKFAFAYGYKSKSSKSAADFVEKLIKVTPYPIKAIQTDNGSEFLGLFDKEIDKQGIPHFFTYPRCPKQNGVIERFNRTLQEEWLEANKILLEYKDLNQLNNPLIDFLLFYNTKRPHQSLDYQEPMKAVTNYLKKSNMYRTHTEN